MISTRTLNTGVVRVVSWGRERTFLITPGTAHRVYEVIVDRENGEAHLVDVIRPGVLYPYEKVSLAHQAITELLKEQEDDDTRDPK